MKIVTTEEMRRLERLADAAGNSYADMMERAGSAVAEVAAGLVDEGASGPVVVLVGPGNNGGDGLVAARKLATRGYQVRLALAKARDEGDANWERARELGIPVTIGTDEQASQQFSAWLAEAGVVVDALLGTGARPSVGGEVGALLANLERCLRERATRRPSIAWATRPCPGDQPAVLAVDLPSGMDADSGAVDELTPQADVTVCIGLPKHGLFRFPGALKVGQLLLCDIGLPAVVAEPGELDLLTAETVRAYLPPRPSDGHKGSFGSAMVVAGSANYVGAALLSAAAAARSGAGLVTLAAIPQVLAGADAVIPEATRLVLPQENGVISSEGAALVQSAVAKYQALLVGPGLTSEKPAGEFLERLAGWQAGGHRGIGFLDTVAPRPTSGIEVTLPPLVLDADALNLAARNRAWLQHLPTDSVITPHPGEMARLLGQSVDEVQKDRTEAAIQAARTWNVVVVLKGAFTVIAHPDGRLALAPFANPALASAGTGDVLAGALAGFLAQGVAPFEAACCAVYAHGLAGELAGEELGEAGVLAGDLLTRLPRALALLRG